MHNENVAARQPTRDPAGRRELASEVAGAMPNRPARVELGVRFALQLSSEDGIDETRMTEKATRKRTYNSPVRSAAALERRARVLDASCRLLGQVENVNAFTLEAVANAAGVTRLTVYNQFGSRRSLMESVFDQIAAMARLEGLVDVVVDEAPIKALETIIQTFCHFWSEPAVMRLQDAVGSDPEFDEALLARHERRRALFKTIAKRFAPRAGKKLRDDVVDTLFALTSPQMYRLLSRGRTARAACTLVTEAGFETFRRLEREG